MITGPILLRTFYDFNSAAPYPEHDTVGGNPGEIVTCSKTGRMWILQKNGVERVYIPVRPEFRYLDPSAGASEAGVKGYIFSSGPFAYQGLELYGPTKVTGSLFEVSNGLASLNAGLSVTGNTSISGLTLNLTSTSTNAAVPALVLNALEPAMTNTTTGANKYWVGVKGNVGIELGDFGGLSNAFRQLALINNTAAAFQTKIQGQKGIYLYKNNVLAPDIPTLGTNEFGEIVATESYDLRKTLGADFTLTANASTEITDLRSSTGTAGTGKSVYVEAIVQFYHTGNHDVIAALSDNGPDNFVSSSKISMNGWGQVKLSGFVPAGNQVRVYVQSTAGVVVKAQVGTYNSPATHITLTETRYPAP